MSQSSLLTTGINSVAKLLVFCLKASILSSLLMNLMLGLIIVFLLNRLREKANVLSSVFRGLGSWNTFHRALKSTNLLLACRIILRIEY